MSSKLQCEKLENRELLAADGLNGMLTVGTSTTDSLPGASHDDLVVAEETAQLATEDLLTSETLQPVIAESVDAAADLDPSENGFLAGDANRDHVFDQNDVMQVHGAGKYLSDKPADWSQGDFTGDGRCDELDIVLALQTGTYAQRSYNWWQSGSWIYILWRGGW